jgi:hypothetical protein
MRRKPRRLLTLVQCLDRPQMQSAARPFTARLGIWLVAADTRTYLAVEQAASWARLVPHIPSARIPSVQRQREHDGPGGTRGTNCSLATTRAAITTVACRRLESAEAIRTMSTQLLFVHNSFRAQPTAPTCASPGRPHTKISGAACWDRGGVLSVLLVARSGQAV